MIQFEREKLAQLIHSISRTSCMAPFLILGLISAVAACSVYFAGGLNWLVIIFAAGFILPALVICFIGGYLLFVDRDSLRSDKYLINKLAIERGLYGDNVAGIRQAEPPTLTSEVTTTTPPPMLSSVSQTPEIAQEKTP